MRVLLVTSWNTSCGIAAYATSLKAAVEAADPDIQVLPSAPHLDPNVGVDTDVIDLVHLNHHDALHSRWTPEHVRQLSEKIPVVVTYHDTHASILDCPKLQALSLWAASTIVHEPVEGLQAIYWRQGVPAPAQWPASYAPLPLMFGWQDGKGILYERSWKASPQQPVLGTMGFNFPWKNYDRLAALTGEEGWALVLCANNATQEDEARWRASNSSILVVRDFIPEAEVINYLAGCDATAFMYECMNTGTSAAIRQGIAARKPVIALQSCRQFRDLYTDPLGQSAIVWVRDWEGLRAALREVMPHRYDSGVHALAEQDSWVELGRDHAQLYRMLVGQPLGQVPA